MEIKQDPIIQNIEHPTVQELLTKFKNRNNINVVEVAEIVAKLISTLKLDFDHGRPKIYTISGEHLGKILGIGKGVVSQYMSVWNMPQESKDFLINYNLSLLNAYQVSRERGKDPAETIALQKKMITEKCAQSSLSATEKKLENLIHILNKSRMILDSIIISNKIPQDILKSSDIIDKDLKKYEDAHQKAKIYQYNINQCINYLSPRIAKLPYFRKEIEFCTAMIDNKETKFCGLEVTLDCLNKQIELIFKEIISIESEQKLPHISSLLMMKNELDKNI